MAQLRTESQCPWQQRAPYAARTPLAVFSSVLVVVAWNMSERDHFRHLLKAPRSGVAVLLLTFALTVFVDLTVAVGVGLALAALLFMRRMSEITNVNGLREELADVAAATGEFPELTDPNSLTRRDVPAGVEVYGINGPFFFGAADILKDVLRELSRPPKVFILRMRRVPSIDAAGMHALEEFSDKCRKQGTTLLLAGIHAAPIFSMARYGLLDRIGEDNLFGNIDDALNHARGLLGLTSKEPPEDAVAESARASVATPPQAVVTCDIVVMGWFLTRTGGSGLLDGPRGRDRRHTFEVEARGGRGETFGRGTGARADVV